MTKHTPGPWSEPCHYGATRFEVQGDGKQVAIVRTLNDARLIAAAPELLAALEQAEMDYAELMAYMRAMKEPGDAIERINDRRKACRAAIAKARGTE